MALIDFESIQSSDFGLGITLTLVFLSSLYSNTVFTTNDKYIQYKLLFCSSFCNILKDLLVLNGNIMFLFVR